MTDLNPAIAKVTDRIIARSRKGRAAYLDLMDRQRDAGTIDDEVLRTVLRGLDLEEAALNRD